VRLEMLTRKPHRFIIFLISLQGHESSAVDPGIFTFVNHGCNGTYNSGTPMPYNEESFLDLPGEYEPFIMGPGDYQVYNPFRERQDSFPSCNSNAALREIEAGEEILCNYLDFAGSAVVEAMLELHRVCTGEDVGAVTEYERANSPEQRLT
jgi:hypothetical protein